MKRTLKVILATLWAVTLTTSTWAAQDIIWFSTSNADPGVAPAGGNNILNFSATGPQTLFLWVTDGIAGGNPAVSPNNTAPVGFPNNIQPSSAGFSYNLGVTTNQSMLTLTGASVNNPIIQTA